jgi:hypothetical protein
MTRKNKRPKPVKEKQPHDAVFHVMVSKGVGKIRSFSLSPRLLFVSVLFFACYIIVSLFIINDYFDKHSTNKAQRIKIDRLQKQVEQVRKRLYQSQQRVILLKNYEKKSSPDVEIALEPERSEPIASKTFEETVTDDDMEVEDDSGETLQTALVEIKDLATLKNEGKLTVNFRIVNMDPGDTTLRGYVHIIVTDKTSDPPQLWTYPKVALRDGVPVNYKRGRLFVIKNFRTLRGEFFLDTHEGSELSLKILVYDNEGNQILQKDFAVEEES